MQNCFILRISSLSLIASLFMTSPVLAVKDRVIPVSPGDLQMNQAIEAARIKLPHFWKVRAALKNG